MRTTLRRCRRLLLLALGCAFAAPALAQNAIHVTYLWHMHQPIYYPYETVNQTDAAGRFNFSVGGVMNDRTGNYTSWPKDAVQQGADRGMAHAGAQCSFSGSLGENLNNLWGGNWFGDFRWARNGLRTSFNNPRLDMVGIAYHHSLMPLTSKESMIMQIRLDKEIYHELWDTTDYSKGFWPPECAFAESVIPALVEEGLQWVLVDNGHFDRACQNYPWVDATSIRPNPADQLNPDPSTIGSQWVQLQNIWAPSKVSAPWGYQPHYVKYVNPATGAEQKMIAVPCGRYEGNENGRGGYGSFKPENVWGTPAANGVNNDSSHPMLIVCHSDGDNYGMKNSDAWHAQHGNFLGMCQSNPNFDNTTVQDYLQLYPPSASDVIHVEPGSWVGIDGGTPYFDKWREQNAGGGGDPLEHPDFWSWSVIVAAQNRVIHADKLENNYSMNDVQWGISTDTAKAWHYYLQGETSCHWYWDYDRGNPWDGNATRACNLAIPWANSVIGRHAGTDPIGPSIFPPQRNIYNPGGKHWNETTNQPSTFQVWTFIDDVNGVTAARLYVRSDLDGLNPIGENDNEVYAQNAAKVTAWAVINMTNSWYPQHHGPQVPEPLNRAMKYDGTISGYSNVLLDYFVEAVDGAGNTNRSDIMHVWVGQSGVVSPVTFQPAVPDNCPGSTLKVAYNSATRNLSGANPVSMVILYAGAGASNEVVMTGTTGGLWGYTSAVPSGATSATVYFKNGGTVDNNSGQNWSLAIAGCAVPAAVTYDPPSPDGCGPVKIMYAPNDGPLNGAAQIKIHVGNNNWQGVITPDPAMILTNGVWTYTYQPPAGAFEIDCVFNNGGATWDNNNGHDYTVGVVNCSASNAPVIFTPGVPRQCDPLVVTYNPTGRPLAGVSPVYIYQRFNGAGGSPIQHVMAAQGGGWVYTNVSLAGITNVLVYFGNSGASIVDDNGGTNWVVAVSTCNTSGPSSVSYTPDTPTGCDPVTITYHPNNGPLAAAASVVIHIGHDSWQEVSDATMAAGTNGTWTHQYVPPAGTAKINLCFNNGSNTWDNNATQDWLINVTGCGAPSGIRFVAGTPQVPQGPTNQQNYAGENFDLNEAGGYASTSNQGGFGSFGRVFVNYDTNNFYIGAYGVDMVGDNNALVLFLEMNTLGDNANNVWDLHGLPHGLDQLHNVWFNQQADLAILLGDEWGDGTFTNFNLGNGYDMGQGAYYLSGSSSSFWPVAGAHITQFDGTGTTATVTSDDDGNRLTERWKVSIPWTSLGSTNGIAGITNCTLYGLIVSDGTNGADRYISGNYLGNSVDESTNGNYGFSFIHINGIPVGLPEVDANGNGIPDSWEMEHFGSLGVVTQNSDWDGDGMPDRLEYWAGTLPKDAASCFRVTSARQDPSAGGGFIVRWYSVAGKVYDLQRSTNLLGGTFDPVSSGIPATPSENVYTDSAVSADTVIYEILSK